MLYQFLYNNATISYRKIGEGKVVVLLHGFGEDSTIFTKQISFLQNYCTLIVPDLPGSGKSEMLVNGINLAVTNNEIIPTNYQVQITDYANCIYALLEQEKIDSCIMLGHSMGGYITLAFAEKFANKLSAFGLIHSTAFADSEEKKNNRKKGIELVENYGAYSFLKNTINSLFGKKFKEQQSQQIDELIEAAKQFTNASLQQYLFAMMNRPDRTEVLKNTIKPVLFIIGSEDAAAPMKDVLQQVSLPQKAYVHVVEKNGHMSMLEAPEELNKYLLNFIQS